MKRIFTPILLAGFVSFLSTGAIASGGCDTTITDTATAYFDRSMDMVYHVANFGGGTPIYERYVCGTNQNYTDISMHYDLPTVSDPSRTISKIELMGFRVRIAVNTVMGTPDEIPYDFYNADANGFPEGSALNSGIITSGGLGNSTEDFMLVDGNGDGTELTDSDGFSIGFTTYDPSMVRDDIFIISNSYCPEGDGQGEKRLKGKFVNSGNWENIVDFAPYSFMDCDAYVFPFLRVTESCAVGIDDNTAPSFTTSVFPNPASEYVRLQFSSEVSEHYELKLLDMQGRVWANANVNAREQLIDVREMPAGIYQVVVQNGTSSVRQNLVIAR